MKVYTNSRTAASKAIAFPGARMNIAKTAHIAGSPILRKSAAVSGPVKRVERILIAVPRASYSASNYGPVGGDARIKVVGVGGGGGNAVNRMISSGLQVGYLLSCESQGLVERYSLSRHPQSRSCMFTGSRVLGSKHRCTGP